MDIAGKVVFITGSTRGIGKDFARVLLQKGAKVCINGTNDEVGRETYKHFQEQYGDNVTYVKCDVRSDGAVTDAFKTVLDKYKRLDIVINNAGIVNESMWETCIDINVKGVIRCTYEAMKYMKKDEERKGGVIVNVSSITGFIPTPVAPCYGAAKSAVIRFTKNLAMLPQTVENGIRMVCICPGPVNTDMLLKLTSEQIIESYLVTLSDIESGKKMSVETVSEGLLKLLEDEDNNGRCLKIHYVEDKLITEYDSN